jgi:hypothetical protein
LSTVQRSPDVLLEVDVEVEVEEDVALELDCELELEVLDAELDDELAPAALVLDVVPVDCWVVAAGGDAGRPRPGRAPFS